MSDEIQPYWPLPPLTVTAAQLARDPSMPARWKAEDRQTQTLPDGGMLVEMRRGDSPALILGRTLDGVIEYGASLAKA